MGHLSAIVWHCMGGSPRLATNATPALTPDHMNTHTQVEKMVMVNMDNQIVRTASIDMTIDSASGLMMPRVAPEGGTANFAIGAANVTNTVGGCLTGCRPCRCTPQQLCSTGYS